MPSTRRTADARQERDRPSWFAIWDHLLGRPNPTASNRVIRFGRIVRLNPKSALTVETRFAISHSGRIS